MSNNLSEDQLKALAEAFEMLDFSQPGAHKCFRILERQLEDLVTGPASWREFRFYAVGYNEAIARQKFETIAPINERENTHGAP